VARLRSVRPVVAPRHPARQDLRWCRWRGPELEHAGARVLLAALVRVLPRLSVGHDVAHAVPARLHVGKLQHAAAGPPGDDDPRVGQHGELHGALPVLRRWGRRGEDTGDAHGRGVDGDQEGDVGRLAHRRRQSHVESDRCRPVVPRVQLDLLVARERVALDRRHPVTVPTGPVELGVWGGARGLAAGRRYVARGAESPGQRSWSSDRGVAGDAWESAGRGRGNRGARRPRTAGAGRRDGPVPDYLQQPRAVACAGVLAAVRSRRGQVVAWGVVAGPRSVARSDAGRGPHGVSRSGPEPLRAGGRGGVLTSPCSATCSNHGRGPRGGRHDDGARRGPEQPGAAGCAGVGSAVVGGGFGGCPSPPPDVRPPARNRTGEVKRRTWSRPHREELRPVGPRPELRGRSGSVVAGQRRFDGCDTPGRQPICAGRRDPRKLSTRCPARPSESRRASGGGGSERTAIEPVGDSRPLPPARRSICLERVECVGWRGCPGWVWLALVGWVCLCGVCCLRTQQCVCDE